MGIITGAESSIEEEYYITSLKIDLHETIVGAIRKHWQLDVSFNEGLRKSKEGHAAANMGLLNKMALNLLKKEKK